MGKLEEQWISNLRSRVQTLERRVLLTELKIEAMAVALGGRELRDHLRGIKDGRAELSPGDVRDGGRGGAAEAPASGAGEAGAVDPEVPERGDAG